MEGMYLKAMVRLCQDSLVVIPNLYAEPIGPTPLPMRKNRVTTDEYKSSRMKILHDDYSTRCLWTAMTRITSTTHQRKLAMV